MKIMKKKSCFTNRKLFVNHFCLSFPFCLFLMVMVLKTKKQTNKSLNI